MTRPSVLMLHCYAEGRPGHWMAICLDLDIAVDGPTLPAVTESLDQAINAFCEHVLTLPVADQQRLLRRKAPLSLRLKFLWHALRSLWNRPNGGNNPKGRADFTLPAHCQV